MSKTDVRSIMTFTIRAVVIITLISVVGSCFHVLLKEETATTQLREEHGGIVPGKEALDSSGTIYKVYTITHEGNTYTCFSRDYRSLGCAKE